MNHDIRLIILKYLPWSYTYSILTATNKNWFYTCKKRIAHLDKINPPTRIDMRQKIENLKMLQCSFSNRDHDLSNFKNYLFLQRRIFSLKKCSLADVLVDELHTRFKRSKYNIKRLLCIPLSISNNVWISYWIDLIKN